MRDLLITKFITVFICLAFIFSTFMTNVLAADVQEGLNSSAPWSEPETIDLLTLLSKHDSLNWIIIGDSISAPSANGTNANWVTMLEHRIKNELGRNHDTFVNVGIAGYSYQTFLKNWQERVGKYNPDVAVVFLGMNGGNSKSDIEQTYEKLKETNPDILIIPISTSPQKYTSYENQSYGDRGTWAKTVTTLETAKEYNLSAINLMQGFLDRRGEIEAIYGNELVDPSNEKTDAMFETMYFRSKTTLMAHNGQPDDIHPDNGGHPLIAKIILKQLGLWDIENSSVCQYIENEKYNWNQTKSPYVKLNKSSVVQKQFPAAYAKFMGAYSDGTSIHKSFPVLALVGGNTFSGCRDYIGLRNTSQQIAYIIGLRSNMSSKYNNSRVINAGFADTTINEMTELFEKKVAPVGSTLVLFMPDFYVTSDPTPSEITNYKNCLEKVISLSMSNGSELGFVTPPAVGDYKDSYIDKYINTLIQTASENNIPVIDFNRVMKDTAKDYPNIYKDWYGEDGKPNIAMDAVLTDCIMDSIGYVNDSGISNYFAVNMISQHTYRQNKLIASSQNFSDGKWHITFNISNLNADGNVSGLLNGNEIALTRDGNYVTVEMPNLVNTFKLYYTSGNKKYYTPEFKQYVESVLETDSGADVTIATGSGRCSVSLDKSNVNITQALHEAPNHPYRVINVRANASDSGYTLAKKADEAQKIASVKACIVDQNEVSYADSLFTSAKMGVLCVYDKDGKLVYMKNAENEKDAVKICGEIYNIFGPFADVRAKIYTK